MNVNLAYDTYRGSNFSSTTRNVHVSAIAHFVYPWQNELLLRTDSSRSWSFSWRVRPTCRHNSSTSTGARQPACSVAQMEWLCKPYQRWTGEPNRAKGRIKTLYRDSLRIMPRQDPKRRMRVAPTYMAAHIPFHTQKRTSDLRSGSTYTAFRCLWSLDWTRNVRSRFYSNIISALDLSSRLAQSRE